MASQSSQSSTENYDMHMYFSKVYSTSDNSSQHVDETQGFDEDCSVVQTESVEEDSSRPEADHSVVEDSNIAEEVAVRMESPTLKRGFIIKGRNKRLSLYASKRRRRKNVVEVANTVHDNEIHTGKRKRSASTKYRRKRQFKLACGQSRAKLRYSLRLAKNQALDEGNVSDQSDHEQEVPETVAVDSVLDEDISGTESTHGEVGHQCLVSHSEQIGNSDTCSYIAPTVDNVQKCIDDGDTIATSHASTQLSKPPEYEGLTLKRKRQMERLMDFSLLNQLLDKLDEEKLSEDFIKMVEFASDGTISTDNLSFRVAMETARFYNCTNTKNMQYSSLTKDFWRCLYKLCGGPTIRALMGFKGSRMDISDKAEFDPKKCHINFPVPSENTLRKVPSEIPKHIEPSIFGHVLANMASCEDLQSRDYVLTFDSKGVSQGFRGENLGDVSLWGHEGFPTLPEQNNRLQEELETVEKLMNDTSSDNIEETKIVLRDTLQIIAHRMRDMRKLIDAQITSKKKYENFIKNNPDNEKRYKYSLSAATAKEFTCRSLVKRGLQLSKRICEICAELNGCGELFSNASTVDLSRCSNHWALKPPHMIHKGVLSNSEFIKQRTPEWHALRNRAKVTGSTAFKACGLSKFEDQKQHYKEYVLKEKQTVSADLQEKFDYGTKHEVDAVATFCAVLAPALFPLCHAFIETGPLFIETIENGDFMEISSDGKFKCVMGDDKCPLNCTQNGATNKFNIEIKCPFNVDNPWYNFRYVLPVHYSSQLLAQMFAYGTDRSLFLTYTPESVCLCEVEHFPEVWQEQLDMLTELYGGSSVDKPSRLHPGVAQLKTKLEMFAACNTTVLAEVPSVCGVEGDFLSEDKNSPYREVAPYSDEDILIECEEINPNLHVLSAECSSFIRDCHGASRRKASEVIVFLLSDTDRMKSDSQSFHSTMIAYGLKGNSLPGPQLRAMVDDIRMEAQKVGIRIVGECFDGQWANLCFKTNTGSPLTLLELQKQAWNACKDLSTNGILSRLQDLSLVKEADLELMSGLGRCDFPVQSGNILFSVNYEDGHRVVTLTSLGGDLERPGAMSLVTMHHVNLTLDEVHKFKVNEGRTKIRGLQSYENDLLCTLPQQILDDLSDEIATDDLPEYDIPVDLTLPDLELPMTALERVLMSDKFPLLDDIYHRLKETYPTKWAKLKRKDLYPGLLRNGAKLYADSRHDDLNLIADVLMEYNGRPVFYQNDKKDKKVKAIVEMFGDSTLITGGKPEVVSLKDMCMNKIRRFPPLVLHTVYANVLHHYNRQEWEAAATVDMEAYIPVLNSYVPMFSFPEYNEARDELMPRLMDYTHQLTNLRSVVCRKGIDNVKREAFWEVAEKFPRVISKAAVYDVLDKQSASIALNMFSTEVQECLQFLGHKHEAFFVRIVREWHSAMDSRSISADQRVNWLWQMYAYLTKDVDFDKFPAPGSYVKGIPVVTYAGILQGICTRIQAYSFNRRNTFNTRVYSSMECESLFSWMTMAEPTGTGCPKAVDMPKIVSDMLIIQDYKTRQDRKFILKTSYRTIYPVKTIPHLNDVHGEIDSTSAYKNHEFDMPAEHKRTKRKRKTDVTFGDAPLKGVKSIRNKYHKIDESNILPTHFPHN